MLCSKSCLCLVRLLTLAAHCVVNRLVINCTASQGVGLAVLAVDRSPLQQVREIAVRVYERSFRVLQIGSVQQQETKGIGRARHVSKNVEHKWERNRRSILVRPNTRLGGFKHASSGETGSSSKFPSCRLPSRVEQNSTWREKEEPRRRHRGCKFTQG